MNDDPFDNLDPKDGYHVRCLDADGLALYAEVYAGGFLCNLSPSLNPEAATVLVASWPNDDQVSRGLCTRLELVLDAVARYLTTGGSWGELESSLHMLKKLAPGGLDFTGYDYLDGYSTTNGTYQHIFRKQGPRDELVLWEEPGPDLVGGFIERTTTSELEKQRDNDESIWGGVEEEDFTPLGPEADPVDHVDREDSEVKRLPGGGGGV